MKNMVAAKNMGATIFGKKYRGGFVPSEKKHGADHKRLN
jgi:hypothetical protein